jgi:DNA-binding IclR family transcriptional regulator
MMGTGDTGKQRQPPAGDTAAEPSWKQLAREHPKLSRSLAVGLGVLECFESERGALDLAELTSRLGVGSTSTLQRYTAVLVADGYLEQTAATRSYRLAAPAADVALAKLHSLAVCRQARAELRRLRRRLGYTVSLVALDDTHAVYLDRCTGHRRGQYEIDQNIGIGARLPAYCTAAGKVLIANLAPAKRKQLLTRIELKRHGPNSILSKVVLRRELQGVLQAGFALSDQDLTEDLRSIAAPVANERGTVLAALEVSVPTEQVSCEALIESFSHQLRTTAAMIVVAPDDFQGTG